MLSNMMPSGFEFLQPEAENPENVFAESVEGTNLNDERVRIALENCKDARKLIKPEQAKILQMMKAAKSDKERLFRNWQFETIEWQVNRAADLAEQRLKLLDSIKTEADQEREFQRCWANGHVKGTFYWFENYAFGFDPREDSPIRVAPFGLFPFQEGYIEWIERAVFVERRGGAVEKARDMGATVGFLLWCVKQWRFRKYFTALLASATEDLVDSKKDPDTLFEKIRFSIRLLPSWMLPRGFDVGRDMPYMNITNPDNGSNIAGSAPTENIGRQRRRAVTMGDEYAAWPFGGYKQHTALSQTCRSFFKISSVQGRHNKFAEETHTVGANVYYMDWNEHPWKDQRWYDGLELGLAGPAMSKEEIAQEIDRNYDASQPGKVFRDWREEYACIEWSELVAFYAQYKLDHKFYFTKEQGGGYRVPDDFGWCRAQDRGETEKHPRVTSYMARPRDNYPMSDTVFVFGEIVHETAAPLAIVYKEMMDFEKKLGLVGYPDWSQNSHEADKERDVFFDSFNLMFEPWDTDYNSGIPQIKEWLNLIETDKDNPWRPVLKGRTRIIFVCADGQAKLLKNESTNRFFVTPATDHAGFILARKEMPGYHYPPEEAGKPLKKQRPFKLMDDFIDTLRGHATVWGPSINEETDDEKDERDLARRDPEMSADAVEGADIEERPFAGLSRQRALRRVKLNRLARQTNLGTHGTNSSDILAQINRNMGAFGESQLRREAKEMANKRRETQRKTSGMPTTGSPLLDRLERIRRGRK